MRQITEQAVKAFYNREDFKKDNTEIVNTNGQTAFRLFGNTIAILNPDNKLLITDAGWQSKTTKERLNALDGVSITVKNFKWYLNKERWDGEWIEIKQ